MISKDRNTTLVITLVDTLAALPRPNYRSAGCIQNGLGFAV